MGICELCGNGKALYISSVEGSELSVCESCKGFGRIVREKKEDVKEEKGRSEKRARPVKPSCPEIIQVIKEDYAARIRKSREKTGLTQKEFAKKIGEKESIIHHIETGKHEPNISLARKLEKALRIRLVEEEEIKQEHMKTGSEEITIGDLIKIKKR